MKLSQLTLPWLAALGAATEQSQISKNPDVTPSAQESTVVGSQYSTLLTSIIRQPELALHDTDAALDNQGELDAADSDSDDSDVEHPTDGQANMFDVDANFDSDLDDTGSGLVATGSSDKHRPKKHDPDDDDDEDEDADDKKEKKTEKKEDKKERKAEKKNVIRVKWYKQPNCKHHSYRSNSKMSLDSCERMHRPAAYKFKSKKKHGKKHKHDDEDDDDDMEYGANCTIKFYNDKKCQKQVWSHSGSTDASDAGCINIGRTRNSDNDRHKGMGKPKNAIWSAMLTCGDADGDDGDDGVDDDDSSDSVDSSQYGSSSRTAGASKTIGYASTKATGTKGASKTGTKKTSKTSFEVEPTETDKSDDENESDNDEEPDLEEKETGTKRTSKTATKKASKTLSEVEPTESDKHDDDNKSDDEEKESDAEENQPDVTEKDSDDGWKEVKSEDKKPDDDTVT